MSESSRPSPERAQRLYDIAVSIGRGETLSEATQAALSAYLRQLECAAGGIFRRDSEPAVPVYQLVESVSMDPTATEVVEAATGDLTHDGAADETAFRERLPITATHGPAHYHVFDLPEFGVLVIVSDDGPLHAEMIAALEPLNETLADVCCARWTDTSAGRPHETLRTVFDTIPRELSVTDSEGTYTLAKEAAAAAHGISVDKLEEATDGNYPSPGEKRDAQRTAGQKLRETRVQHEQTNPVLQTVLDSLPTGVLVEDSNRNVLAVNQRLLELFEIDAPPETLVGAESDDMIDRLKDSFAEPEQFVARTNQLARDRHVEKGQELALTGSRTVARDYVPYELPGGGAHSWVYRDVTERVRRETAIGDLLGISPQTKGGFKQQVQKVIEIGRQRIGMEAGFFSAVDTDTDPAVGGFEFEVSSGSDVQFDTQTEVPLAETYCRETIEQPEPVGMTNARETWDGDPADDRFGLACYLGGRVIVDGEVYGTLCFTDNKPREKPFTQEESRFLSLLTQWLGFELECRNREADLRQTRRQLRQSNRDLEQFAHAASHDLKEPLRSVSNYLTLLDDLYEDGETLDAQAVTLIEDAVGAAERMQSMINALLQYSRIDSSGGEFEPAALDGVVEKAELNLTVRIDDSGATVTTDPLPTVEGDEQLLIELFQNLIDNGLKYNHSSHPHISVTPGDPVATLDTPDRVSLDSDDRGITCVSQTTVSD
jgi:Bacteriophytochrome (light-regulated signal transduction histidine kinase)